MFEIITFGGAVVDAFLETGMPEKNKELCVPLGYKLLVKNIWFATGGGGTNTATAFSRLGLKTGFIGKLGKDANAKLILEELKKEKIDFLGTFGQEPTGYSVILNSEKQNRTILTFKGANETLKFSELQLKKLKTKWFYFSSMPGKTLETQVKLAKFAVKNKIKVAYNPSSYLTKTNPPLLKQLLKFTNVLILNNEEASHLANKNNIFSNLHKLGPEIVCITHGEKGNKVSDGENIFSAFPRKVKVKERTGAGDAFASGFVAGLVKFNNLTKAIEIGSLNAESVIQKPGAKNGLLTWREMSSQLKNNKIKITCS
ncbi:MAG: carbohydrate kinase family protein [Nanoarchaeota archaeon]|nr:carbohydrate kinase family protein [Nanoarchaeota archaeon]MBU1104211.1 carbohydrate kinase family protein [Nanoarchaeota archaeon]